MQADWQLTAERFAAGLLAPSVPMPEWLGRDPKRYSVYRNNVTVGLINALELNFPAISRLVGKDFFRAMARDYAAAHPPKTPLMSQFGGNLPEFLAAAPQLHAYPYLPDVATLEIQWLQSYHEADAPVLGGAVLQNIDPEALFAACVEPHPSLRMLKSDYPAASIMRANRTDDPVTTIAARAESVIIVRPALEVTVHVADNNLYTFIATLANGAQLGAAAEETLTLYPETNLPELIASTISLGVFSSLKAN